MSDLQLYHRSCRFFCLNFGGYISFCIFANRNYSVIAKTKEVGIRINVWKTLRI